MKIMTFNTQHCLDYKAGVVDYELMARTIRDEGAELVALNEMFNGGIFCEQTRELSALTGLKHHYFAQAIIDRDGPYGNGLLSSVPFKSVETIIIPDPSPKREGGWYETRCLLKARLENGLLVLVTHFGLEPDEQRNAVKAVLEHIEPTMCVLMGDFNITPDNALLDKIREKMVDTLHGTDLKSWPSDEPRLKIDYIFTTPDIKVIRADIPPIVASDHRPHIAEIQL